MSQPVFAPDGNEIGQFDGEKFIMSKGPNWVVSDGNVYEEGDEGGVSFKGQVRGDIICSMTGEVVCTIGEPFKEE